MIAAGAHIYAGAFYTGLAPTKALTVSEWADENRYLSRESSAEPGRYRTDRTPYLREIMDCLSESSPVEEVVFMKGSQIGGSEAGFNFIGYGIDHAPCPMMMVQPTVDLAKRVSKQRIEPMIRESPALRSKVKDANKRNSGNTILAKEFPGGLIVLAGANSAPALRSMPVKFLFLDEIDAYPRDVGGEGSPVRLAEKRTKTFARKKVFKVSTPTYKGMSAIEDAYEASDKRRYYVPCPHCDHYQTLKWSNLKWKKDDRDHLVPGSVKYECESCRDLIEEHHKTTMLRLGKWIADNPGAKNGKVAGFHLSAMYSPVGWYSWEEMVQAWYEAQKDTDKLKVFVNTDLGETFEIRGEESPEWNDLYQRRESFEIGIVPDRVCLLTAAVDVQKDRLEVTIVGWNRQESWVIDHTVINGETSNAITEEPWISLDKVLFGDHFTAKGQARTIKMSAIDSGYNTNRVYEYVRARGQRRIMAVKGSDTLNMPIGTPKNLDIRLASGKKIKRGVRLWSVGVNVIKSDIYGRLKIPPPTDAEIKAKGYPELYVHFPMLGEEYFKQLTGEKCVIHRGNNGKERVEWIKTHTNNEALDTFVYNIAAFYGIGANRWNDQKWVALGSEVGVKVDVKETPKESKDPPKRPAPRRERSKTSSFW